MEKNTELEIIQMENAIVLERPEISTEIKKQVMGMQELMEMSKFMAKSTIVPLLFQNRPENCYIALDLASRMDLSPMMVMQNLYVIQGKPSFSGSFIGALIRSDAQFKNVELVYVGDKDANGEYSINEKYGAYVRAIRTRDGSEVRGGTVTLRIAKAEGWTTKTGSKWLTIPTIMLAHRAYAWFGRQHCPELLMGMQMQDEVYDIIEQGEPTGTKNPYISGDK